MLVRFQEGKSINSNNHARRIHVNRIFAIENLLDFSCPLQKLHYILGKIEMKHQLNENGKNQAKCIFTIHIYSPEN